MIPYERRQTIEAYLRDRKFAYIKDICAHLQASVSTVRRDLAAMEKEGRVTLLSGGGVTVEKEGYEAPVALKLAVHTKEKKLIAQRAAARVEDGDFIYIDSGTTTGFMLEYLKQKRLTVVTSNLILSGAAIPPRHQTGFWGRGVPAGAPLGGRLTHREGTAGPLL